MLSMYETGAEAVSDLSDAKNKPAEPSSNVSKRLPREGSADSPSSCEASEYLSLCSEPSPRDDRFRVCSYLGSSEPVLPRLPHFSRDFISPLSETFSEFHVKQEPALPFSLIQGYSTPEPFGAMSSAPEGPTEPPATKPCSGREHSRPTYLLRSLSHQSDSLEGDTATAHMSDLYIYESETQDFIHIDPPEIQRPLSQTGGTIPDCDTQVPMCDSDNVVTLCRRGSGEDDSEVSQRAKPATADADEARSMSGNDDMRGNAEVTDSSPRSWRSNSPMELWVDACQYLAGEDAGDRAGHSVMQGVDLSFPPGGTRVSGYNLDGREGIGRSSDDTRGREPPIERWSSMDSWASALSDWTGIITAPQEDFTAAFTEIGAEIDALTQALAEVNAHRQPETSKEGKGPEPAVGPLMGVQDLEVQNLPESSVLAGQCCLSLCLEAPGLRGVGSLCDSAAPCQHSSTGGSSGAPGGPGVDVIPGSTSSADLNPSHFGGFVESVFSDNEGDPIVLNITEDADLEEQNTPVNLMIEEPVGDEVCEVTDGVSQPDSVIEQEVERSRRSAEVDHQGIEPSTNPHFLGSRDRTNTLPNLDGACQVEPGRGSPKFIMPLAPLSILALSSLVCRTSRNSGGEQTCAKRTLDDNGDPGCFHVRRCALWPTSDGITDETSLELIHEKGNTIKTAEQSSPDGQLDLVTVGKTTIEEIHELSNSADVPADRLIVSDRNRVAFITLDLNDPFVSRAAKPVATQAELNKKTAEKMPHKTHKCTSESKARSKKDKTAGHHHGAQASKKQENLSHVPAQQVCKQQEIHPLGAEKHTSENAQVGLEDKEAKLVIEAGVAAEKAANKPHGKKKKKPNAAGAKSAGEPLAEVENGATPKTAKGRIDMFEAKLGGKVGKAPKHGDQSEEQPEAKAKAPQGEQTPRHADRKDQPAKNFPGPLNDDIIKRRRLSEGTFGKAVRVLESKIPKQDVPVQKKAEEPKVETGATRKKAYSEVVKQKIPPKEEPKVVQPIQAASVSGDQQSLCLWCQFAAVSSCCTVTWSRGDAVLSDGTRSAGDESRVSLTISNASHKDLGQYQCRLAGLHGSVTLDYQLTYEVLSEIVIPPSPKTTSSVPVEVGSEEEEDVRCSRLIFKEDFLSDQHFGENQPASIITEKVHFGEGMHRRAFRTKMQAGRTPPLPPGHSCVLKVHNSISYGTTNNDELVQKNFSLAVEECHVQNTAREYIKAYTSVARSVEAFGEIPEIIPIYLVHRPSNDVPYATLEEELIGDFVKYSVKDGKEINLRRNDSEAGQKCCAFQHWVYHKTEGNLLVTDMQGVGMRLTDVGIATCKKGYKGFKGNCATSFIDQFKALHQCNTYCEILGLKSLQPKPKKPAAKPKAPPSAAPKKKTFWPKVNAKS